MEPIAINPHDPFPLEELSPENYVRAKRYSAAVDAWLGLRIADTEKSLHDPGDGEERWAWLDPSVFLTPYGELRAWLEELKPAPGEAVVDLGAGYGRLGFVMARHFPGSRFLGFELAPERVREGAEALARFGAGNALLAQANIADRGWSPPEEAIYFIYDFGKPESMAKILRDLRAVASRRGIRVVGRGRGVRDQIERDHPWLGSVHPPVNRRHYSIYRSFA